MALYDISDVDIDTHAYYLGQAPSFYDIVTGHMLRWFTSNKFHIEGDHDYPTTPPKLLFKDFVLPYTWTTSGIVIFNTYNIL